MAQYISNIQRVDHGIMIVTLQGQPNDIQITIMNTYASHTGYRKEKEHTRGEKKHDRSDPKTPSRNMLCVYRQNGRKQRNPAAAPEFPGEFPGCWIPRGISREPGRGSLFPGKSDAAANFPGYFPGNFPGNVQFPWEFHGKLDAAADCPWNFPGSQTP